MNVGMRTTRLFAWSGVAATVVWLVGFFLVAGFVPPPSPERSAVEVAQHFAQNADQIRVGLIITCFGAALIGPWVGAISVFLRRIEGRDSPAAWVNLALGGLLSLEFILPIMVWQTATYRPERDPELTSTLNDLGWIPFIGVTATAIVQAIVIAIPILKDTSANPIFPRWVGYMSLFAAVTFSPSSFVMFFKNGPLAWNGIIAFWLLVVCYVAWTLILSIMMIKVSYRLEEEEASPPGPHAAQPGLGVVVPESAR